MANGEFNKQRPSEHREGSWVYFWSKTRGKWVHALVRAISRDETGAPKTYELDLHVEVLPALICRPGEPHDVQKQETSSGSGVQSAVGDHVWYWSHTYSKWVDASVREVQQGPDGKATRYQLAARMSADASRVRPSPRPISERPTAAPSDTQKKAVTTGDAMNAATSELDVPHEFNVGDIVHYRSETTSRWVDATVQRRYKRNGSVVYYDLDIKKGVSIDRLRPSPSNFQIGDVVEFWSASAGRWLSARLLQLDARGGRCDLNVKRGAPLSRVRKVSQALVGAPAAPTSLQEPVGSLEEEPREGGRLRRWRQWGTSAATPRRSPDDQKEIPAADPDEQSDCGASEDGEDDRPKTGTAERCSRSVSGSPVSSAPLQRLPARRDSRQRNHTGGTQQRPEGARGRRDCHRTGGDCSRSGSQGSSSLPPRPTRRSRTRSPAWRHRSRSRHRDDFPARHAGTGRAFGRGRSRSRTRSPERFSTRCHEDWNRPHQQKATLRPRGRQGGCRDSRGDHRTRASAGRRRSRSCRSVSRRRSRDADGRPWGWRAKARPRRG